MVAIGAPVVSEEKARAMVKEAERQFADQDIPAILETFTEDCVVRYSAQPVIHGRAELKAWLERRFSRQKDYTLAKTLQMLAGNKVCITWEGEWIDIPSGKRMQGRGVEVWTLAGERTADWRASFSTWDKGDPSGVTLG